jgi:hypothetical protein
VALWSAAQALDSGVALWSAAQALDSGVVLWSAAQALDWGVVQWSVTGYMPGSGISKCIPFQFYFRYSSLFLRHGVHSYRHTHWLFRSTRYHLSTKILQMNSQQQSDRTWLRLPILCHPPLTKHLQIPSVLNKYPLILHKCG